MIRCGGCGELVEALFIRRLCKPCIRKRLTEWETLHNDVEAAEVELGKLRWKDADSVAEFLAGALSASGYEGLYQVDGECACTVDDLAPCDGPMDTCMPGVIGPCPGDCGEHDWHVCARASVAGKVA